MLKRKNPTWTPPPNIRAEDPRLPAVVPAGPNNPLGQFALSLGWPGYLIHGTTQPSSIGKPASHGCMRMYPEDVAVLFSMVEVGTSVTVVDTPVKLGWSSDDKLYLEVTPTQSQARALAGNRKPADEILSEAELILHNVEAQGVTIDWVTANAALQRHDGIPVVIGVRPLMPVGGH